MLELKDVSLKLASNGNTILNRINYQVQPGDFIIILGSNGSGKSSLMKLIDRRFQPTQGQIFLNGKSVNNYHRSLFSKKVTTLTQNCHDSLFPSLTVFENYLLVKQRHESTLFGFRHHKERALLADHLQEFNINLVNKLDQVVDQLSGGEKQALALALSVLYPPEILLLDEHTSALDPKSADQLMLITHRIVTTHQITCILTTHDLDIAMQYGNRVLALKHGQIYQTFDHERKKQINQQELLAACY